MSEKKEIMFTQIQQRESASSKCCVVSSVLPVVQKVPISYVFLYCYYFLSVCAVLFLLPSTQKTQLLIQSKCIKADVIYAPSAVRQDCMLIPAAVTWVSSSPAISLQPEHTPKVSFCSDGVTA